MSGAGCSRVTHPFAARVPRKAFPLDLHVLSTPPAFVLSQDQTLQQKLGKLSRQQTNVAKGIQAGTNRPGYKTIGTGFTSTLLSSQRTTAPEALPPSGHSFYFTLALPLRQIPEISRKCVAKSSSPAKTTPRTIHDDPPNNFLGFPS